MPSATLQRLLFARKGLLAVPTTLSAFGTLDTPAARSQGLFAPGVGTGVWPAVTNLLTSPTDFSNAAWATNANTQKTSTTALDPGGGSTGCLVTVAATAASSLYQQVTVLASTAYTFSWWAKLGTATLVSYLIYDQTNSASIVTTTAYQALLNASAFSKVSVSFTTPVGCVAVRIYPIWANPAAAADTISIAWPQLETGAVATPFTPTSRAAGRIQLPNVAPYQLITAGAGAVAMRVQMGWVNTAPPSFRALWRWYDAADDQLTVYRSSNTTLWSVERDATPSTQARASASNTFAAGDRVSVVSLWDATQTLISHNGGVYTGGANALIPSMAATFIDLGSINGTSAHIAANILIAVFWNANSDLAAVQANPALITSLLAQGVTDLNAYPGNPSGIWDGNTPEMVFVRAA